MMIRKMAPETRAKNTETPQTASDFTQDKDTKFPADLQEVPCIGCLRWCYCGGFAWTECVRFKIYLHNRREATK